MAKTERLISREYQRMDSKFIDNLIDAMTNCLLAGGVVSFDEIKAEYPQYSDDTIYRIIIEILQSLESDYRGLKWLKFILGLVKQDELLKEKRLLQDKVLLMALVKAMIDGHALDLVADNFGYPIDDIQPMKPNK